MFRKMRIFYDWIRGYNLDDPWRNGEYRFLRSYIGDGMVVFDVGAHVGDWTDYLLSLGKNTEVHCFEPVPSTFERLSQRFSHHPKTSQVFLNNVGLSEKSGTAMMKIYGEYAGSNSLYERRSAIGSHPSFASFHEQKVQLITLDDYLAGAKLDRIIFVKIDVKGNELKVLQGASMALSSGRIQCIQFEYGGSFLDSGASLKEIWNILRQHGYEVFRLLPFGKIRICSFKPQLENYRYSNWVAIKNI